MSCSNRRVSLFIKTLLFKSNNLLITLECWSAMIHYLQINNDADVPINKKSSCYKINNHCLVFILANCPSLFAFPASPALLGHVYFYYSNNQSINKLAEGNTTAKPMYVCYNETLCPFLPWTITINESTCLHFDHLSSESSWFGALEDLSKIFWSCSPNGISQEHCAHDGFFQCENSSKCIPDRRLMDGTADCINASDERKIHSCKSNDPLRFSCESEDACLSHLLLSDGIQNCVEGEDEDTPSKGPKDEWISFPTVCDGFIDVNLYRYMHNASTETDEIHCDLWPCSHLYTRCDEFWNCPNGIDELDCPHSSGLCSGKGFLCVSPETFQLICLSFVNANDSHVDCLGGSDERFDCRLSCPNNPQSRYRCWDSSECILMDQLCLGTDQCPFAADRKFCDTIESSTGICERYRDHPNLEQHPSFQFLCALDESDRPDVLHFGLTQRELASMSRWEQMLIKSSSSQDYTNGNLNVAWLCNRGLLVRHRNEDELIDDCLCPPAYYANRCQFQNQRVSLSFRVQTFEMRTVFHLTISLIDNTSQIHSL